MSDLEKLLTDVKESLEREIHAFRDEMRGRFDTQAARLERHAGYWRTGQLWSVRMDEWAAKVDVLLETKDRQITELRDRLSALEKRLNGGGK